VSQSAGSRRFVIVASASGNGKTTLGRELAARLGVEFVELDSWVHGPDWTETATPELIARLEPVLASDGWVIDGTYEGKLGARVLDAADVVVWLDLPLAVWFTRLVRRTGRRIVHQETLWNGNRETILGVVWGRQSLFADALRTFMRRRREWPLWTSSYPAVRLRSAVEVAGFLERFAPRGGTGTGT
jgi:adenylate kinase family enzyme